MAVSAALALAPTALRAIGSLFGKSSRQGKVAERVANVVDAVQGKSTGEKNAAISKELSRMSPEDRAAYYEIEARIKAIEEETKQAEIEADYRKFEAEQETHRAALEQSDVFTKRTRPQIARQSWLVAAFYGIGVGVILPTLQIFNSDLGNISFSETIFLALSSPALTYMGVRCLEKWKSGGTKT